MANKTDEELDRDWKPSGRRPQSTIARSFSQELMDIFRIENSVADLDEKIDKRKHTVQAQTSELEQLEQRIREMEERLKRNQNGNFQRTDNQSQASASRQQHAPHRQDGAPPPPLPKDLPEKSRQRPLTARQNQQHHAPSSANMPPTPVGSEGEYDLIDKQDLDDSPPPPPRHPRH